MASGEAIPVEPLQHKTIVLRTSIHCPGCSKKVKRIIQSIPGIHNFAIDPSQNKVSITGDAEAGVIIKKFLKSNKQVELWPEKSKPSTNIANAKTSSEKNHSKEINTSIDLSENKKPDERFKEKAKTVDPEAPSKADENDPKTQRGRAVADLDDGGKKCENQEGKSGGDCSGGEKKEKMAAQKETNSADSRAAESSATEGGGSSGGGEKKEKMVVQKETNSAGSGGVESSSATEGTTSLPPPPPLQQPQNMTYQTPAPTAAYVMSYNMAQPSTAHSYYAFPATPPPLPPPSQGYFYSSYAPPPPPPPPPPPEFFYGLPSEWGSPAPPPESYHMFNDENANSCNVM